MGLGGTTSLVFLVFLSGLSLSLTSTRPEVDELTRVGATVCTLLLKLWGLGLGQSDVVVL